jgi:hypothetical protein
MSFFLQIMEKVFCFFGSLRAAARAHRQWRTAEEAFPRHQVKEGLPLSSFLSEIPRNLI